MPGGSSPAGWMSGCRQGLAEAAAGGELAPRCRPAPRHRAHVRPDAGNPDRQHRAGRGRLVWLPVRRSWRLNERHYGALQGRTRRRPARNTATSSFMLWRGRMTCRRRRSPNHDMLPQRADPRYALLPDELSPRSECLKDVVHRMMPYWHDAIIRPGGWPGGAGHGPWQLAARAGQAPGRQSGTRRSPGSISRPASRSSTNSTRVPAHRGRRPLPGPGSGRGRGRRGGQPGKVTRGGTARPVAVTSG